MKRSAPFILLILLSAACSVKQAPDIDIIPLQFVLSGGSETLVVEDLFYADDYASLSFREHPHVQAVLSDDKRELMLHADKDFSGYTTLCFIFRDHRYDLPLKVIKRKSIRFTYEAKENVRNVSVFGNFNAWRKDQFFMEKDKDGHFSITLPFEPGQYEYLFSIEGKEIPDPSNPDSVSNGRGGYHSSLRVLADFKGTRPLITPHHYTLGNRLELTFNILSNDYTGKMSHYNIIALADNHRLPAGGIRLRNNKLTLTIPNKTATATRRIRLAWTNENTTSNFQEVLLENGKPAANGGAFKWQDAIIYSLLVDRFHNGNPANDDLILHADLADESNYRGGDLQGVIYKLDEGYFNDLGVNTLWILPFVKNTPHAFYKTSPPGRMSGAYHGYWPVSGRETDPHYGNNNDVRSLVSAMHYRGLRLLMDFVSNHVHAEHPYYRHHPEWFAPYDLPDGRKNLRLFDEYEQTTWLEPFLPSFDYQNAPEALDTVIADAIWWIKNFNVDGFRHAAAEHLPREFWRTLTRRIRAEFPDEDFYQLGSSAGNRARIHSYVNNGQLSAQFNVNLYRLAQDAFAVENTDFSGLAAEMERTVDMYGQNHLMVNLMDGPDLPRYPAYLERDINRNNDAAGAGEYAEIRVDDPETYEKIKMYMTYLMTIPGPPLIYYGDEVAMTGGAEPDNRRMMDWRWSGRQKDLKQYISAMTALRSKHPALRYGDYSTVRADKEVFAYLRSDFNERILVVINRNNYQGDVHITLPETYGISDLECLNGHPSVKKQSLNGNTFNIQAEPHTGYVFRVLD